MSSQLLPKMGSTSVQQSVSPLPTGCQEAVLNICREGNPAQQYVFLKLHQSLANQSGTQISSHWSLVWGKWYVYISPHIDPLWALYWPQACHPDLVLKSKTNLHFSTDVVEVTICQLCNDIAKDTIKSKCHHIFNHKCIKQYCKAASGRDPDCPVCHIPLSINLEAEALKLAEDVVNKACQGILGHLELDMWRSSSKIEVLVKELSNLQRQDCTTKSIVFSQLCMNVLSQHRVIYSWLPTHSVNFLDLIAYWLKRAGFPSIHYPAQAWWSVCPQLCHLEGTMSPQAHDTTIKHFSVLYLVLFFPSPYHHSLVNNIDVTVFLVSLKAGGVVLNLTEASWVYLTSSMQLTPGGRLSTPG